MWPKPWECRNFRNVSSRNNPNPDISSLTLRVVCDVLLSKTQPMRNRKRRFVDYFELFLQQESWISILLKLNFSCSWFEIQNDLNLIFPINNTPGTNPHDSVMRRNGIISPRKCRQRPFLLSPPHNSNMFLLQLFMYFSNFQGLSHCADGKCVWSLWQWVVLFRDGCLGPWLLQASAAWLQGSNWQRWLKLGSLNKESRRLYSPSWTTTKTKAWHSHSLLWREIRKRMTWGTVVPA